ncbi:hypothetical protein CkaCkLH20_07354 [Colletotrichum karsti]|uniref:Uncharacterized protein n=1 Tax=Colletotrichum karsti TaxID=1095194 RepID=A0A9P6I265_9PEZI|nr:uncharacterized protein CkaCkLH20_07354 [Colletotrichum karsti]KAF9875088.1 hypothetical protein CkaCkLH20_07354 [Colletotrichum karsti]
MRFSGLTYLFATEFVLSGVSAVALNNPFEGAGHGNEKRAKCNANNCARAVTGTANGLQATRLADCSSFMQCFVTPIAVTVTDTVTISVEAETTKTSFFTLTRDKYPEVVIRSRGPLYKRTDGVNAVPVTSCPAAVPTYASACSGAVRYSSACSCGGVTQSYSTLGAAVSTVTSTVTRTKPDGFTVTTEVTITHPTRTVTFEPSHLTVANPTGRFRLRTVGDEYNDLYAVGSTGSKLEGWMWFAVTGTNSYFEINSTTGYLTDFGYQFVKQKIGREGGEIGTPFNRDDSTFGPVKFRTVSNDGGATLWMPAFGTNFQAKIQVCPPDDDHSYAPWFWLGSQDRDGCTQVALKIVPI